MPELPEVETVLKTLENLIKDEKIIDVQIFWDNIILSDKKYFVENIVSQCFKDFKRRGKYLIFELNDFYLISHLRMEGKYFFYEQKHEKDKHTHVIFTFESGKQLHYNDVRKFGKMELVSKTYDLKNFKNLGPEPFWEDFNESYVLDYFKNYKGSIKAVLLEQNFVAGIGNIYADEICFDAKLDPRTDIKKMNKKDIKNIISSTRKILSKAILQGGTTIRSYTSSLGVSGKFQLYLMVHQRKGEECKICGNVIEKIVVATRGTYFCKRCQKLKI